LRVFSAQERLSTPRPTSKKEKTCLPSTLSCSSALVWTLVLTTSPATKRHATNKDQLLLFSMSSTLACQKQLFPPKKMAAHKVIVLSSLSRSSASMTSPATTKNATNKDRLLFSTLSALALDCDSFHPKNGTWQSSHLFLRWLWHR